MLVEKGKEEKASCSRLVLQREDELKITQNMYNSKMATLNVLFSHFLTILLCRFRYKVDQRKEQIVFYLLICLI